MTPTKLRLASALREVSASPANAAKYEAFAKRAETGEFDDYESPHAFPSSLLYTELLQAGFTKFAARVGDGEFDATKEEADAWAASPEGREMFQKLLRP